MLELHALQVATKHAMYYLECYSNLQHNYGYKNDVTRKVIAPKFEHGLHSTLRTLFVASAHAQLATMLYWKTRMCGWSLPGALGVLGGLIAGY